MNHEAADPRWSLVAARAPAASFLYAVTTTGVYCRTICPARRPKPENVRFFATATAAEAAGFRPCLRCRPGRDAPTDATAAKVAAACRRIETAEAPPTLGQLADEAGLSPFHFHRIFKAATGITPKAYAAAHRTQRVRTALAVGGTVTQAIYDAGFNASSRFYEGAREQLGMTPTALRAAGVGETIRYASCPSTLGVVLAALSTAGVCAISLGDDRQALAAALRTRFAGATLVEESANLARHLAEIVAFIETPVRGLALPLDIRGTAFQRRVWEALRQIPPGETASYAEIAGRLGAPHAARAVAGACAANTLAVAIPCHRVLRGDGVLSGYRWDSARKRALLEREAADAG